MASMATSNGKYGVADSGTPAAAIRLRANNDAAAIRLGACNIIQLILGFTCTYVGAELGTDLQLIANLPGFTCT